jgi:predicted nuclease with TOPRIM domain
MNTDNSIALPVDPIPAVFEFQVGEATIVYRDKQFFQADQPYDLSQLAATLNQQFEKFNGDYPYLLNQPTLSDLAAQKILKTILAAGETIDVRIERMEAELSAQRNLDQSQAELEKLRKELAELEDQFGAVKSLITKLNETKTQINNLHTKVVATTEQVGELRSIVLNFIRTTLKQPTGRISSVIKNVKSYVVNMPLWPLILFAGINFLFATVQTITLKDVRIMALGLVLVTLQAGLIVYFLANQKRPELAVAGEIETPTTQAVTAELLVQPNQEPSVKSYLEKNKLSDVTSAFVDNALQQAYESEIEKLNITISNQLGETDVNQLQDQIKAKTNEVTKLAQQIEEAQKHVLSPDQYLRKRRELDMLKMEKRRDAFEQPEANNGWTNMLSNIFTNAIAVQVDIAAEWRSVVGDNPSLAAISYTNGQLNIAAQPVSSIPAEALTAMPAKLLALIKSVSIKLGNTGLMLWPIILPAELAPQLTSEVRSVVSLKV